MTLFAALIQRNTSKHNKIF